MKYILLFFFTLLPLNAYSSAKNEIKNKLELTNNLQFKFIQNINNKTERGECKISYPKKILCKYDDIFEKVLVSNGRSLVINSKKIVNYLIYKLKDTPLDLILDKNFLINKIDEIDKVEENDESYFFKIKHNESLIKIYFNKNNFDIMGWTTVDMYQNKVETILYEVETNLMIDDKIFRVQKYIN